MPRITAETGARKPRGGGARPKTVKVEKEAVKAEPWLRQLDSKSRNVRKKSAHQSNGSAGWDVLYKGLQNMLPTTGAGATMTNTVQRMAPHAVDRTVSALHHITTSFLPIAISKSVPTVLSSVAYSMTSNYLVPFLVDTVIPAAVDNIVPEQTRLEVALIRSEREHLSGSTDT